MNIYKSLLSTVCLLVIQVVRADSITIGAVYPIAEPDALQEIHTRAQGINWQSAMAPPKTIKSMQPVHLPQATEDKLRQYIPWYSLPHALTDKSGHILYPSGYTFNPLQYVRMPMRLVVTDSKHLAALKPQLNDTDMILLTAGNASQVADRWERPVFALTQAVKQRLGLQYQPAIIKQEGFHLEIHEILLKGSAT